MSMKEPLKLGLILGVIALVISVMLAFADVYKRQLKQCPYDTRTTTQVSDWRTL